MKKIIAIMLAACCLLSLAVCGAKEADYKLGLGVTLNNVADGYSLLQALVSSVAVGLGFLLAMVVFCGVRSKIVEQNVPKAFRGLPIQQMAASILALVAF